VLESRDDLPAVEGTDPGNWEMQEIRGGAYESSATAR